jgi:hypothetical protein
MMPTGLPLPSRMMLRSPALGSGSFSDVYSMGRLAVALFLPARTSTANSSAIAPSPPNPKASGRAVRLGSCAARDRMNSAQYALHLAVSMNVHAQQEWRLAFDARGRTKGASRPFDACPTEGAVAFTPHAWPEAPTRLLPTATSRRRS